MDYTSGKVLARTLDEARNITRFYFSKMKGEDMFKSFEINGYHTNSPYWVMAHLCWAEHMLLIECMGLPSMDIPWLKDFRLGSVKGELPENKPSLKEVLSTLKTIHGSALEKLESMTDEELDQENEKGIAFGENTSKRFIAMHTIRHEGTHAGQLSLIVQMYGRKTV